MAEKQTIHIKADLTQYRGLMKALNAMDKDAKKQLKEDVKPISQMVAKEIKIAAAHAPYPKQAMAIAKTVRAKKDRIPYVSIGGSTKVFSNGQTAGQALIGSEFGAYPNSPAGSFPNGGNKFPFRSAREGRGNAGYWIYPTAKKLQPEVTRMWKHACEKVLDNWERG